MCGHKPAAAACSGGGAGLRVRLHRLGIIQRQRHARRKASLRQRGKAVFPGCQITGNSYTRPDTHRGRPRRRPAEAGTFHLRRPQLVCRPHRYGRCRRCFSIPGRISNCRSRQTLRRRGAARLPPRLAAPLNRIILQPDPVHALFPGREKRPRSRLRVFGVDISPPVLQTPRPGIPACRLVSTISRCGAPPSAGGLPS